jgi:hypothetical protein
MSITNIDEEHITNQDNVPAMEQIEIISDVVAIDPLSGQQPEYTLPSAPGFETKISVLRTDKYALVTSISHDKKEKHIKRLYKPMSPLNDLLYSRIPRWILPVLILTYYICTIIKIYDLFHAILFTCLLISMFIFRIIFVSIISFKKRTSINYNLQLDAVKYTYIEILLMIVVQYMNIVLDGILNALFTMILFCELWSIFNLEKNCLSLIMDLQNAIDLLKS